MTRQVLLEPALETAAGIAAAGHVIVIAKAVEIPVAATEQAQALRQQFDFVQIEVEHEQGMAQRVALGRQALVHDLTLVQAGVQFHTSFES